MPASEDKTTNVTLDVASNILEEDTARDIDPY